MNDVIRTKSDEFERFRQTSTPDPVTKIQPTNITHVMASVAAGQSHGSGANWGRGTTRLDLLNSPSASVADSDGRLAFRRSLRRRFAPVSALRAGNAL